MPTLTRTNVRAARDAVIIGIAEGAIPVELLDHEPDLLDPMLVGCRAAAILLTYPPRDHDVILAVADRVPDNELVQLMAEVVRRDMVEQWRAMLLDPELKADVYAML